MTTNFKRNLIIFIFLFLSSFYINAQCKSVTSDPTKGEFSISGVKVKGDGDGVGTASNNIPIKICEGELIKLKSTLPITALSSVNYWITPLSNYNSLASPPSMIASATASYSNANGDAEIKMISKIDDPKGFSFYSTPGRYVITQFDNSVAVQGGPGFHHACQVIEIIKPEAPVATYSVCSNSEVQVTFPANITNLYDDYQIQYRSIPEISYFPIVNTGKPSSYPFVSRSESLLSSFEKVKIEIKGQSVTGGCPADKLIFDNVVLNKNALLKPALTSITGTTQSGESKLAVSTDNNIKRKIYFRDPSNFNSFDYSTHLTTYISGANALDSIGVRIPNIEKSYCFQVEAIDAICPNATNNPALRSDELCTTLIKVEAQNNKNVITWSKALGGGLVGANFTNYRVDRFRTDGTFDRTLLSSTNINTTTFDDGNILCGNDYLYRVTTRYPLNSTSQLVKVKATSTEIPFKIPRLFTSIQVKKARIQGLFDLNNVPSNLSPNNFKFYRSESLNGTYNLVSTGNSFVDDSSVEIDKKSYCYYMTWTNLCKNESAQSDKVCSTLLTSDATNLKWNSETSVSTGVDSYIVQEVDKNGFNVQALEIIPALNKTVFDLQKITLDYGQEKFIQIETRAVGWNTTTSPNLLPSTLSNVIRVYKNPLANEEDNSISLKIYPVPSQEIINVELKTDKPESMNWVLNTMSGQAVKQDSVDTKKANHQTQIDIKGLITGTYILRIQSGENIVVRKIVKE